MTSILIDQQEMSKALPEMTLFIVMGVSGSGKTVIGKKLAKNLSKQLDFLFLDADDFHSPQAKKMMANNLPLDNEMRKPWVAAIISKLASLYEARKNVVLAFSGLKSQHRECLRTLNFNCHFFYLSAEINIISSRMKERKNHFFKAELLQSQFSAMEKVNDKEQDITQFDVTVSLDEVYNQVFMHAQQKLTMER
jgi:gluconokinase